MNRSGRAALLLLPMLCVSVPAFPLTEEERGDQAYRQRNTGFVETGAPSPRPIEAAIVAYEKALEERPEDLRLYIKLMDALYFKGYFVVQDKKARLRIFDRLVELSSRTLELLGKAPELGPALAESPLEERAEILRQVPEAAAVHFWAAASWGLWGMTHSPLAAIRKGVVGKVRDHARMVLLIDESYENGGGLRLLGRLQTHAPKVPLITGWIDRQEGLSLLRRALAISRRDPRNLLFLAEAILEYDEAHRAEALELLREIDRRGPAADNVVEETETVEQARRLLAGLERG